MKRFLIIGILLSAPAVKAADVEWVSISTSPAVHPMIYTNPHLSADGRFVVFDVRDPELPDRPNRPRDVYLIDRERKTVKKIEAGSGVRANGFPYINDNGRYIAFHSYPLEGVRDLAPRYSQIFIFDRLLNISFLQMFGAGDRKEEGETLNPALSADGRYIVFSSNSSSYSSDQTQSVRRIYGYDRQFNSFETLSRSLETGVDANRPSGDVRLSQNGRFVAFKSAATNLVQNRPLSDLSNHLYLLDRRDRTMVGVDESSGTFDSSKYLVGTFDMDGLGRTIVFEGRERKGKSVLSVLLHSDLFLFDRSTGTVRLLTSGIFAGKSASPALSGNGRYLAFTFKGLRDDHYDSGLIIYDIENNIWRKVVEGTCFNPSFSRDGRFVVFEAEQKDLVTGSPSDVRQIFIVKNPFLL